MPPSICAIASTPARPGLAETKACARKEGYAHPPGLRIALAAFASLLAHALLLAMVLHPRPPAPGIRPETSTALLMLHIENPPQPAARDERVAPPPLHEQDARARPSRRRPPTSARTESRIADVEQPIGTARAGEGKAPGPQAIDLDSAYRIARESARGERGSRAPESATSAPGSREVLSRGLARAARPPCATTYSAYGLLAAPLLLKDALTQKGCKW